MHAILNEEKNKTKQKKNILFIKTRKQKTQ